MHVYNTKGAEHASWRNAVDSESITITGRNNTVSDTKTNAPKPSHTFERSTWHVKVFLILFPLKG